jgi:hypothetical protein
VGYLLLFGLGYRITARDASVKPVFLGFWDGRGGSILQSTAALLERGRHYKARDPLRLRGGDMGPRAQLVPENGDVLVHCPSPDMPRPDHRCLRSALHRTRVKKWNGRRIFVSSSYNSRLPKPEQLQNRYSWDKPIRIGTMKFGSGNASSVRVSGDDEAQIWGQWHFAGPATGILQGLYCMYTNYGPYKPLVRQLMLTGTQVLSYWNKRSSLRMRMRTDDY